MPTYDYRCEAGHRYETREPFGSPSEQPCQRCGKPARRLLNVPPLVFKGGGFYKTESRKSSNGRPSAARDSDDDGGSTSGGGRSRKSETKAAPKDGASEPAGSAVAESSAED